MNQLSVLVRHNATLVLREPGPVLSRLAQPVVLITLMRPLYTAAVPGSNGTLDVVTGMQVMFSMLALSVVGSAILTERTWHTWDRLRATSARPSTMLLAKAVPAFAVLLAQQAVVLCFGVLAFGMRVADASLMMLAVVCWVLALLGIGTTFGALLRSQSELNVAYDIGGVLLSALGGALVPLSRLPGWARAMAPGSPAYWAVSALRSAAAGSVEPTLRACGLLLVVAVVFGTLACWRISRGWARSRLL
jgi:ABC-2 type transport system permease protein